MSAPTREDVEEVVQEVKQKGQEVAKNQRNDLLNKLNKTLPEKEEKQEDKKKEDKKKKEEKKKEDKKKKEEKKKKDEKKKKIAKKEIAGKAMQHGAGMVARSGDFIGRMGTLIVMLVTTVNTTTVMVTSFLEEIYWIGGIHAALLAFVHLPVILVMIWMMCKARMSAIYRKVRPKKEEDGVEAGSDSSSSSSSDDSDDDDDKKDKKKKDKKQKDQININGDVEKSIEEVEKKIEAKKAQAIRRANRGVHINQAFEMV